MSDAPRTQYAKSGELHLAYQVFGDGPLDLLVMSGYFPLDSLDDEPSLARFHRRLASFSRLIRFNPRGLGLSDPVSPSNPPTFEQWAEDARCVLDAVGSERAALFSFSAQAAEAVVLATRYPARISHLIVVNGTARVMWAPDYPIGTRREDFAAVAEVMFEPDAVERGLDLLALANPSVAKDPTYRAWWDRVGNQGASPAMARAVSQMRNAADVRPLLAAIEVPTLVVHRRANAFLPVDHGRYLAEHIPNAKYVELEGADNSYWVGDTNDMLDEIEEFLTGARQGQEPDRALVAVLFTDIVASTERLVEVGEQGWRDLLDRHDAAVRRELRRFGGREVNTTGDGFIATFSGPARAVQCACAIRDAARRLGIAVRVGVHVGEVELRGADVAGITVHVAARITALADAGEVLVSRTVPDLVVGTSIAFKDRGERQLKGVPGTWQLFSVIES